MQIPNFFLQTKKHENDVVEISLRFSFYDSLQKCFVGQTWHQSKGNCGIQTNTNIFVVKNYWIYLKCIPIEAKWVVVELVTQLRTDNVVTLSIALGWTVLPIFSNVKALVDVHPTENEKDPLRRESKQKILTLFQGSPSYLLLSSNIDSMPQTSIVLKYKAFTFTRMNIISHLVCENSFVGYMDKLPCLDSQIPNNPFVDEWKNTLSLDIHKFFLTNPKVYIPSGFDSNIVQQLTSLRRMHFSNVTDFIVGIKRKLLLVSFYNGRSMISKTVTMDLESHEQNSNILLYSGTVHFTVPANVCKFSFCTIYCTLNL